MSTYALSTFLFADSERSEAIEKIAAAGFAEVELSAEPDHWGAWIQEPAQLRRELEDEGLVARTVHSASAGWSNGAPDAAMRRASILAAAESLHHAAEVGAEIVICHPNGPHSEYTVEAYEANWARSRDSLALLADQARAAGVRMAVENLPSYGNPRPGTSVAKVLEFIEGLGDHVGICQDAGHSNANGLSAAEEALAAGDKLFALHIQDNDGGGQDQHLAPGRGSADWDAFLDALAQLRFSGPRTFEVSRGGTPEALLHALAGLRDDWSARWP